MLKLSSLYTLGLKRFYQGEGLDDIDSFEKISSDETREARQLLSHLQKYVLICKSNDFAFVDVCNEKTFQHNAAVVREFVTLLQKYRLRGSYRYEFLSELYELLIGTKSKQEAGQFFTPAPLARFIIASLPLRVYAEKRTDKDGVVIPTVIDFACGSGIFLAEYLDEMDRIIQVNAANDMGFSLKNDSPFCQNRKNQLGSRDKIYGIELDDRLAKTAVANMLFGGENDPVILNANGLDSFSKSEKYLGKLKLPVGEQTQDNGQFDILLSNPPFSISAFMNTVPYCRESFGLYQYLTSFSSEIECLFVERMKQLLKVGGWAGIILPSNILTKAGINKKAYEIIYKYFYIKAVVKLGAKAFMDTATNTEILFLERRDDNDWVEVYNAVDRFFLDNQDTDVNGIVTAFSTFVNHVYPHISYNGYLRLLNNPESIEELGFTDNGVSDSLRKRILKREKEKMIRFLLTYTQDIVLVRADQADKETELLGYSFSNRRGAEGMRWNPEKTKLYDISGKLLPSKINTYIRQSFLGGKLEIDKSVSDYISYVSLGSLLGY